MKLFFIAILFSSLTFISEKSHERYVVFDFETANTLPMFESIGTTYELVENPMVSDDNLSLLVGKVVKNVGQSHDDSGVAADLPMTLDFSNGGIIRLKVLAPTRGGLIKIKFEVKGGIIPSSEIYVGIDVINQWDELSVSIKKAPYKYKRIAISFDVGGTA